MPRDAKEARGSIRPAVQSSPGRARGEQVAARETMGRSGLRRALGQRPGEGSSRGFAPRPCARQAGKRKETVYVISAVGFYVPN